MYMFRLHHIAAAFWALFLFSACRPQPPEDPGRVYMGVLIDTTGSRLVKSDIQASFYESIKEMAEESGCKWYLELYHASAAAPKPKQLRIKPLPPPPDILETDYREKENQIEEIRRLNQRATETFIADMQASGKKAGIEKEYTWLNKNIAFLCSHLTDTTFVYRFAFLDTDFLNDTAAEDEGFISDKAISQLRQVVEGGAIIFVYTESDYDMLRSRGVRAKQVSQDDWVLEHIQDIIQQQKQNNYGQ